MRIQELWNRATAVVFPPKVVHAHCDIPCGIYDPHFAQIAALTIVRMNQLIADLQQPGPTSTLADWEAFQHKLARYTEVKEKHAETAKNELRILWGDYFTAEHLQKFPELHQHFWDAMKLGSKARQEINMQAAQDLLTKVQQIAEIFWKTKGAEVRKQPSLQKSGGDLVYPVAK